MKSNYLMYLFIAGIAMSICVSVAIYHLLSIPLIELYKEKKMKLSIFIISLCSGIFIASLILFVELIKVVRYL
jgi:hypothetical protein